MQVPTRVATLRQAIWPRTGVISDAVLVVSFAIITALFARITVPVPWSPVPITGQTFAVLLAGAVLGSKAGALSMLTYVVVGAAGMPFWFSATTPPGLPGLMGPTGGYIIGFVPGAFVVGFLAERGWDRRYWTAVLAMLLGNYTIYLLGLPRLAQFATIIERIYASALKQWPWLDYLPGGLVFKAGVLPYIPGDLTKILLAAAILPSAWMLVRRIKPNL
ncbi:MAG: biotin transporter BioY [Chloroflexi bacterium]|nr:biotin transporter BioY [Chloroflexota bacterium]